MARNYGTIEGSFWNDPDARRLSSESKLLYSYLRTSSHSSPAGAYYLPIPYIIHDTQFTEFQVVQAFRELALKPFALYDIHASVVTVPGLWLEKSNLPANPNVATYMARQLLGLPECQLKARAISEFKRECAFTEVSAKVLGGYVALDDQPSLPLTLPQILLPAPTAVSDKKPKKRELTPGTRLPSDWTAPTDYRQYALEKGFPESSVDGIETKFRRYFTSPDAKQPVKKSWHRAWCNWVDSEYDRSPPKKNGVNGHHSIPADEGRTWEGRMESWAAGAWSAMWGPEPGRPGCKVPQALLPPE